MTNAKARLLMGSGVALIGGALIYAARMRSRNRSLLARTRKQAGVLADHARHQAARLGDAAADGIADAFEAGKAAYQRVAG
jgi:hypothetical protein